MPRVTAITTMHYCSICCYDTTQDRAACPHGGANDKVWGAAVIETEPFAPRDARWRYVGFYCRRGQLPTAKPKSFSSEREATTEYSRKVLEKEREGYVRIDWTDPAYNLESTVRELGTLPGEPPKPAAKPAASTRTHDFVYGATNNQGDDVCRMCGQIRGTESHGYVIERVVGPDPTTTSHVFVGRASDPTTCKICSRLGFSPVHRHQFVPRRGKPMDCDLCGRAVGAEFHRVDPLPPADPAAPAPAPQRPAATAPPKQQPRTAAELLAVEHQRERKELPF